jgi:hypothetical protein
MTLSARATATVLSKIKKASIQSKPVAERKGFEPSIPFRGIHTFQACSFNHSDTSLVEKECKEAYFLLYIQILNRILIAVIQNRLFVPNLLVAISLVYGSIRYCGNLLLGYMGRFSFLWDDLEDKTILNYWLLHPKRY